jgi:hypothetical protein
MSKPSLGDFVSAVGKIRQETSDRSRNTTGRLARR